MKRTTATYKNTHPEYSGETIRQFTNQIDAERWLLSHGAGKYTELYIDGILMNNKELLIASAKRMLEKGRITEEEYVQRIAYLKGNK